MIPLHLAERIGKFVRLLGSDKDGEVVAAARAISRSLASENLDLHALAASIGCGRGPASTGHGDDRATYSAQAAGNPFNYANHFAQADKVGGRPDHPDAMTGKFGLCIYAPDCVEPWREVCRHCLELNRTIPKRHGGKFLRDFEVTILDLIIDNKRWPTNAHAAWIETVVARCHQARAAQAKAGAAKKAEATGAGDGPRP